MAGFGIMSDSIWACIDAVGDKSLGASLDDTKPETSLHYNVYNVVNGVLHVYMISILLNSRTSLITQHCFAVNLQLNQCLLIPKITFLLRVRASRNRFSTYNISELLSRKQLRTPIHRSRNGAA
jgi:hypothetical protein